MSRRSTPERIAAAHEAGIRNWLRDDVRGPRSDLLSLAIIPLTHPKARRPVSTM